MRTHFVGPDNMGLFVACGRQRTVGMPWTNDPQETTCYNCMRTMEWGSAQ